MQTGLANSTYVQIVKGLNEGDRVVVTLDTSDDDSPFVFSVGGMRGVQGTVAIPGGQPPMGR